MSILQQESMLDSIESNEDKQEMNDIPFDKEESSNSEQNNESIGNNSTDAKGG
jgi:hypothetical protein